MSIAVEQNETKQCPDRGIVFSTGETIANYFNLARRVASSYTHLRPIDQTDEFGDACVGLLLAAQTFEGGGAFSTWATWCMKREIFRGKRRLRQEAKIETELIQFNSPIMDLLLDLPPNEKELILSWANGEDLKKIARSFGITLRGLRKKIGKIIQKLR